MRMLSEIRISGFGGQGVMLAANIIGKAAAIFEGGYATMTESYGPEARGGASSAQLVLSSEPVLYPYVDSPDVLVVLSQEAFSRFGPGIKRGGILLVEDDMVRVEGVAPDVRVFAVPATRLAEELGRKIVLNVVMVGFFAAITGLLSREACLKAIADSVPQKVVSLNERAFEKGFDYGRQLMETGVARIAEEVCSTELSL
jgi:2-oxoglutarate ferredoxin oxidoreductase subunit gamma